MSKFDFVSLEIIFEDIRLCISGAMLLICGGASLILASVWLFKLFTLLFMGGA